MRAIAVLFCCLAVAAVPSRNAEPIVRPEPRAQTPPMPHAGDSADDPAIWIHPTDPSRSLLLGTDKQGSLHVYTMDGPPRQVVSVGSMPNNVDVVYGMTLGGKAVDIAIASTRASSSRGIKVWTIDAETGLLRDLSPGKALPVFRNGTPYGICGYRSRRDGRCYAIVVSATGEVEQHWLKDAGNGTIRAARVRAFRMRSISEGCVVDDEHGWLYIAEERVGIWRFGAEPNSGDDRKLIARVGEHGLTPDVEGLTIYAAANGQGYLIASSQGSSTFKVYQRTGNNDFVLTIDPARGALGDVSDTDGIAVTSCATTPQFSRGAFVVQDGRVTGANQNFKIYRWEDIAGSKLLVDTAQSPRPREKEAAALPHRGP